MVAEERPSFLLVVLEVVVELLGWSWRRWWRNTSLSGGGGVLLVELVVAEERPSFSP